ncbi:MAG: HAD hydrolase family protein [Actinomycetota bacterium]|nr:HAD hydrolase family protein [Actinomycetota bacterium]
MAALDDSGLRAHLCTLPPARMLYTDLDGTLLGPDGSLLTGPDGRPSTRAAQALVTAADAGLTVVPVSGRRREQLENDARLMGLRSCIAEAGCVVVRDGQARYQWGQCPAGLADNPHDALDEAGAVAALLEAFAGDLRPYEPWHLGREGSHLLHGLIDVEKANAVLSEAGFGWAYVIDNGATGGWPGREVRAYHLLPRGVGKATAVADDLAARGLSPQEAAACGDSLEDLRMAEVVGTYLQVANGHGEPGGRVFGVAGAMGDGFADAVTALLEARRDG